MRSPRLSRNAPNGASGAKHALFCPAFPEYTVTIFQGRMFLGNTMLGASFIGSRVEFLQQFDFTIDKALQRVAIKPGRRVKSERLAAALFAQGR